MKQWLRTFLGIDLLREDIEEVQIALEEHEINQAQLHELVVPLHQDMEKLGLSLEEHVATVVLNTKSVQKEFQRLSARLDRLDALMKKVLVLPEENEIEKEESPEIPVTDDMHIPIVSGMKVRFETEGVETDIHID